MERKQRIEILKRIQAACDEVTQGYHAQTGRNNIRFIVLQLEDSSSKLFEGTDIIRKTSQLYDEYEGNEEYIHIPDVQQMLKNFEENIVVGIEDMDTGELEGVTTIKYYENIGEAVNPYYPKKDTKYFEVTGVIIKQRRDMSNKGLGTGMYEACFLGLQKYANMHQDENYRLNAVIDCTNIKSLYAAQNAINNINSRNLLGSGKKMQLNLGGIYVVRDQETKRLVEAPTFIIESDLREHDLSSNEYDDENRKSDVVEFKYVKPNEAYPKHRIYSGLKHSIILRIYRAKQDRKMKLQANKGYKITNEILKDVQENDKIPKIRILDEGTGFVDYIDFSDSEIGIDEIRLERNGTEEVGSKRIPKRNVDEFVGPVPKTTISLDEEER